MCFSIANGIQLFAIYFYSFIMLLVSLVWIGWVGGVLWFHNFESESLHRAPHTILTKSNADEKTLLNYYAIRLNSVSFFHFSFVKMAKWVTQIRCIMLVHYVCVVVILSDFIWNHFGRQMKIIYSNCLVIPFWNI